MPTSCNAGSRKGSALLMVLWLTAALSAVGLAVANNVRGETERTETNVDDTRSYFVARGAVERAALHMLWGRQYFTEDGKPIYYVTGNPSMDLSFPSAEVHVLDGSHFALDTAADEIADLVNAFLHRVA